jgi:hypothetical protein
MKRPLSIVVLAALACLPWAGSVGAQGGVHVFFPNDCQQNVHQPRSITVTCADANFRLTKIKWSSYGATSAKGTATARIDTCDPNCVSGTFKTYAVSVRLSRVKQCGDVPQFGRLTVTFNGSPPEGFDKTETQSFMCADAPSG